MIKRLLLIVVLGGLVSGCFMVPMAFIGPAAGGFSTASIIQSGVTTGANYMVKKSTGKTIAEHAMASLQGDIKQSFNHRLPFFLNLIVFTNKKKDAN